MVERCQLILQSADSNPASGMDVCSRSESALSSWSRSNQPSCGKKTNRGAQNQTKPRQVYIKKNYTFLIIINAIPIILLQPILLFTSNVHQNPIFCKYKVLKLSTYNGTSFQQYLKKKSSVKSYRNAAIVKLRRFYNWYLNYVTMYIVRGISITPLIACEGCLLRVAARLICQITTLRRFPSGNFDDVCPIRKAIKLQAGVCRKNPEAKLPIHIFGTRYMKSATNSWLLRDITNFLTCISLRPKQQIGPNQEITKGQLYKMANRNP